jgi:hypothetical protein
MAFPARLLASLLALTALGCDGNPPSVSEDGGPPDATVDGGAPDAALEDGGPLDAGSRDGGCSERCEPEVPEAYRLVLFERPTGMELAAPYGMNDEGVVVGTAGPEPWSPVSVPVRVRLDGTTITLLEEEGALGYARAAADDGTVVGEHDRQAHVWSGGVRTVLAAPDGYFSGVAHAIGATGLVVGTYADHDDPPPPVGPRPCAWPSRAAPAVPLALLDRERPLGSAVAIDARGRIAGTLSTSSSSVAVIWDSVDAAPRALPLPTGALSVETTAMNERGELVGRAAVTGGTEAFFLRERTGEAWLLGRHEGAPSAGFYYAEARDVSDAGWAVGSALRAEGIAVATLWADGRVIDLDAAVIDRPAGVRRVLSAAAIDVQGRIAVDVLLDGSASDLPRTIGVLVPVP